MFIPKGRLESNASAKVHRASGEIVRGTCPKMFVDPRASVCCGVRLGKRSGLHCIPCFYRQVSDGTQFKKKNSEGGFPKFNFLSVSS